MRDVGRKELSLKVLEDHPDQWSSVAYTSAITGKSADRDDAAKDAALEGGDYPVKAFRDRRFAGARRAHDTDHHARLEYETDAVERRDDRRHDR